MSRSPLPRAFYLTWLIGLATCVPAPPAAPDPVSPGTATQPDTPPFPVMEVAILELQAAMASGRVTSEGLVEAYLLRIAAYDQEGPELNSIIRLNPNARAEARALDVERKARGPRGPLHGIPIVLKDNYDTRNLATTAGSISLAGSLPSEDGFVAARLRAAGAIVLGKTNMQEFAMGVTTLSSIGGQTKNPYDLLRSPGGSSGGTAAAVAGSLAAVGWGTDTCGSLRVPAAFNALFGLRPTKGLTSVKGIVPLCHSQDVSGALARTATDLAIALDATIGLDPADPASDQWRGHPLPRFVDALDSTALRGARIGVLTNFFGRRFTDQEVAGIVHQAIERMRKAGAEVFEVSLPGLDSLALSASLVSFEFRDDLNRYLALHPSVPVGSLSEILERGLYLADLRADYTALNSSPDTASSEYRRAVQQQAELRRQLSQALANQRLDALVYPTVRGEVGLIGDPQHDPNCEPSASAGFPALSIPVGFTADGLPVGMELLGAPLADARLLALGYSWERLAFPRRPPLSTPHLRLRAAPIPAAVQVIVTADAVRAVFDFIFDAPRGRLEYQAVITGLPAGQLLAASLHQGADSAVPLPHGPVIAPLLPPGELKRSGSIALGFPEREALHQGRLYVTVLTTRNPGGTLRGMLPSPATPPIVRP